MRFLIVDDSLAMRRILGNALRELGYNDLVEAKHGADGLVKLEGVDVIFTDWNMPEMDGLTFVKQVRASAEHHDTPIIMVTTEGAKTEYLEAIRAGVTQYVTKPFTAQLIKDKLDKVLA